MRTVIERLGTSTDGGIIRHDERPSTYERAEQIAGRRLDRRRAYAIIGGDVCESAQWSYACSGCYEGYNGHSAAGMGCSECGYTGRRRDGAWVPLTKQKEQK